MQGLGRGVSGVETIGGGRTGERHVMLVGPVVLMLRAARHLAYLVVC